MDAGARAPAGRLLALVPASANAPESDDATFTWEQFAGAVNKDLADVLGNFVNRCLAFVVTRTAGTVPGGRDDVVPGMAELVAEYTACLERFEYRKAMHTLRGCWRARRAPSLGGTRHRGSLPPIHPS